MVVEKIKEYSKRKELSNKAKSELFDILKDIDFSDKLELKNIVAELFNFNASVLGSFILTLNEDQSNLLVEEIDCGNASKSLHIYNVVVSLYKIGNSIAAKNLLEKFVSFNANSVKTNKQIFIGLEKVLETEDSEILTGECVEWNQRSFNCFRKIWVDAVEYLKSEKLSQKAIQWFKNNKLMPSQRESELLKVVKQEEKQETKEETVLNNISIEKLLEEINRKFKDLENIKREKLEVVLLNETLKDEVKNLKQEIFKQQDSFNKIAEAKENREKENENLSKKIIDLKNQLNNQEEEICKLRSKLENVESAFCQAGQTEVDSIVSKIKSRLASEHEKYLEIRKKEPDMDYYEIILSMLDEIYRVLKKNGIIF